MKTDEPLPTPATYQPRYAEQARKLGLVDELADEQLAKALGIDVATLHEWRRTVPEFAEAISYGRTFGDADAADGLLRSATGPNHQAVKIFMFAQWKEPLYAPYDRHFPPNGTSALRWLERRRRKEWGIKTEPDARQNNVEETYSDEELGSELLRRSLARRGTETADPQ